MDERGGKWFGDGKDMGMNMALRHFETQRWEHGWTCLLSIERLTICIADLNRT